jgi:predicted transcriptional regulator
MNTPLVLHIDDELRHRLYWLAEVTDRPLPYLITEALQQYLDTNEWQIRAIEEGIAAAGLGRAIDDESLSLGWKGGPRGE